MGFIYFDGRGCGCWDAALVANAKRLKLQVLYPGHQQVVVQFNHWSEIGELIPDGALFRSVRIEANREYK